MSVRKQLIEACTKALQYVQEEKQTKIYKDMTIKRLQDAIKATQ